MRAGLLGLCVSGTGKVQRPHAASSSSRAYLRTLAARAYGTGLLGLESAPSSSRAYLRKSFLSTRMRMVARKPVSSSTVTHELMMLNQWICGAQGH